MEVNGSSTLRPLYLFGTVPIMYWTNEVWRAPELLCKIWEKKETSWVCQESNRDSWVVQPSVPSLYWLSYDLIYRQINKLTSQLTNTKEHPLNVLTVAQLLKKFTMLCGISGPLHKSGTQGLTQLTGDNCKRSIVIL